MKSEIPEWVTYPRDDWIEITPADAGLDVEKFERFLAGLDVKGASFGGEDHTGDKWGTVLTRGGYLVHAWGNRNYRFQTASMGKAFMWVLIGFAEEEGLLDPDQPIHMSWTGEGELSHPHKYLNRGHHRTLTWRHLIGHLLATRGQWEGEQLVDPAWLRGHSGGNRCGVSGESTHYTAMAQVTTDGFDHPHSIVTTSLLPDGLFVRPVRVSGRR